MDLATLFADFRLATAVEYTLTGNRPLSEAPVTTFPLPGGGSITSPTIPPAPAGPGLTVTVYPMEIRTWQATW